MTDLGLQILKYAAGAYIFLLVFPFLMGVSYRRLWRYKRLPLMKDLRFTVGLTLAAFLLLPQREFLKARRETGISFADWLDALVDHAAASP